MLAANYSTVRNNFKKYLDQVNNGETVIITRKNQQNAVILNMEEYSELAKAKRNAAYLAKIDEARERLEAGQGVKMTMEELSRLVMGNDSENAEAKVA